MFETTFPVDVTVGGFSITTKFLLVTTLFPPPPGLLAPPWPPDDEAEDPSSPSRLVASVTVPHAAHRTELDPFGYASVTLHPEHRKYAVSPLDALRMNPS